jgi:CII-binding regulator of phage lambda lysogenization HflD
VGETPPAINFSAMLKTFYSILSLCVVSMTFAQQQEYFNNIYQHENNFAIGMTILETDDGYVGYGGTEDASKYLSNVVVVQNKQTRRGNDLETLWRQLQQILFW